MKIGQKYYCISDFGVCCREYEHDNIDMFNIACRNVYYTYEDAHMVYIRDLSASLKDYQKY